ncbi:MAG TPA: DUF262 domain-containing protein [Bacteroidales bacterium]|nr:MAG: hypothetical protein A2W98_15210 [Bacteroidetes bacterium GWF2_33_38]OFY74804.1 MAG: hypothetical protein A2265_07570 [Bacteroidetes bacterium RIFOXYA12_FULL_33_9]HBF88826.1 DUF262 domain-containing protein [Bacteroidales bacterium]
MASIKIKDFFNGRFFEIPKYQRGYAWELQNIRDLFDDVIESIESNSNHYIGTIVLSKSSKDDELFYVVDGQQRITTVSLIMNALINQLDKKDSYYYRRFYIKEDNRFRLSPLGRDRKFYFKILQSEDIHPENKSQRFMKDAVEEIENKVSSIPEKLKFLKSIEKLEIMEFVENSEGDAIRIFQTVNDRGKPLSNMEKAKSLLIYFSNRYLNKELDDTINDYFSDIFEIYDDIKHIGEEQNITLIKNKEFNEDNLMRYHFVSYTNEDYDPTATYVLNYLKTRLTNLRNEANGSKDYSKIHDFIKTYISDLKEYFLATRRIIERAKTEPKYYKIFSILNLSATLYPLITKLEMINKLNVNLPSDKNASFTFLDLIEIIDVRIYKTRGTDPKADISGFAYRLNKQFRTEDIENWLLWFNQRWMSKDEFQSNLSSSVYGNRALNLIFIEYCEELKGKKFEIEELNKISSKSPNIEHVLSQTPKFTPRALGFKNTEDFIDYEHTLGNLTILEKSFNSSIQNKSAIDKVDTYGKSIFKMTKKLASDIDTNKSFLKKDIIERTELLSKSIVLRWWC